ncbi:hypothetical protein acdb102_14000 [Acidothermaceae bacterium B102]|nr:hypothetical protein acdb102_14000 [Acidothermaceae bacterium B102]
MAKHEVLYTRYRDGWTAEQVFPVSLTVSGPTLAEVRQAIRDAAAEQVHIDPADLELEELLDSGETRCVRLS